VDSMLSAFRRDALLQAQTPISKSIIHPRVINVVRL
jgi:hypothetical protein